ncbi:hypothetical protein BUALT_Bualt16G0081300 [Buddleja alternifolia]|uniref:SWIM-type domain-containing protein n=1 Tax=Buddleja alternifolia TaxID=168488 RepID=A0AAV6WA51_9LAMI|nr:hypothetical protein BUALT_Bualt16G0081300 [Buddleja alternifolia]
MATVAANMMLQCVFDGSLSMRDMDIERRPYHKNCKCALHKVKGKCSHVGSQLSIVSFSKREFRNNCSFSLSASTISSQSSSIRDSLSKSRESINENSGRSSATPLDLDRFEEECFLMYILVKVM